VQPARHPIRPASPDCGSLFRHHHTDTTTTLLIDLGWEGDPIIPSTFRCRVIFPSLSHLPLSVSLVSFSLSYWGTRLICGRGASNGTKTQRQAQPAARPGKEKVLI
jgi:hypothetical protein